MLSGLFFALLVVLTLGGNTIRALSMPKVITDVPTVGSLDFSHEGIAVVRPAAERELANPAGWKVLDVLVTTGDTVKKGQTLVRYDDSDAQDLLAEQQSALKKMELSLDALEYDLKQALRSGDEGTILDASSALERTRLDIADQQRRIGKLQKEIASGRELKAPVDGIVTAVGAEAGVAATGVPDVRLTDISKGYLIRLAVPGELAAMVSPGEEPDSITLAEDDGRRLTGVFTAIGEAYDGGTASTDGSFSGGSDQSSPGTALLTISLAEDEHGLQGGERVKVRIRKSEGGNVLLVPNEAVHYDSEGAFLYTISAHPGPLGNAYYAKQTRIETAGSNEYATAVIGGIFEQSEIIVGSSGLIQDGTRVRF